ncbi:hypothetical protein AVEN_59414-1, partial [Araneus ventricosus]
MKTANGMRELWILSVGNAWNTRTVSRCGMGKCRVVDSVECENRGYWKKIMYEVKIVGLLEWTVCKVWQMNRGSRQ